MLAQRLGQALGLRGQLRVAGQRQHRDLHRGQPWVEAQHRALLQLALGVGRLVLDVGVQQERQHRAADTGGRLDDVRRPALLGLLVVVGEVLAGGLGVGAEVVVGAVGDTLQLAPLVAAELEAVLDVSGALGVVGELLLRVLVPPHVLLAQAETGVPVPALPHPVLLPLLVLARLDEELHLHLLELTGAEDEVAGRDLVAERLAHLGDAERRLAARSGLHLGEVGEDALGGLGAEVSDRAAVLRRAEVGGEEARELLGLGELALVAAVGAVEVGEAVLREVALLGLVRLLQVVGAEPLVTGGALRQRVREGGDMAGGDPDLGGQDDGRVDTDDVLARRHHVAPPLALEVLLELDTERPVVPGGALTAVDLTTGEYEATALAQADDGVDLVGGHGALFITNGRQRMPQVTGAAHPCIKSVPHPHLVDNGFQIC